MYCGKCGKEISDMDEFCMHCGSKIETISDMSENKKNVSNKKRLFIAIPMLLIIIIGTVLALKYYVFADKGYIRNTIWGMTPEQVQESEETELMGDYKDNKLMYMLTDIEGIKGLNGFVIYKFDSDGNLISGSLNLIFNTGKFDTDKICNDIVLIYDKKYGKEHEKTELAYKWITSKSNIEMSVLVEGAVIINFSQVK